MAFQDEVAEIDPSMTKGLLMSPHSPMRCTDCNVTEDEVETFIVVRRRGLFAMLCFRGGSGCYERSAKTMCSFIDNHGIQCTLLQEHEIVVNGVTVSKSCSEHLSALLPKSVDAIAIYPLD
jgi:hypothetical protein